MTRFPFKFLVAAMSIAVAGAAGAAVLAAQQTPEPGKPTTARFYILNKTVAEAVPVTAVGTVAVSAAAPITIDLTPAALAALTDLRDARPAWEYREIAVDPSFQPGQAVPALSAAGRDGWEVCGVIALAGGHQGVLLKRAIRR